LPEGTVSDLADDWPPSPASPDFASIRSVVRAPSQNERSERARRVGSAQGGIERVVYPGADVLVRSKRGSGLVTLGFHVAGVVTDETAANAGISALLSRLALRGAGGLSGEELAQVAETLGGRIGGAVGADTVGWWITVRPDAVERAATLLGLVAGEPALASSDVAVERGLLASDARRAHDDMFGFPVQQALGQALPGDAYGLPPLGEPQVVAIIDRTALDRWAERVRTSRAAVVAVGDLEPSAIVGALEKLAGDWVGSRTRRQTKTPVEWASGRGSEERLKEQTAVAMVFPGVPSGSAERYPMLVLASVLSGLAGRLFEELREVRSLAYTVTAFPWFAQRAGALVAYVAASPDREDEAREVMLDVLRRVVAEPPSDGELERARRYAAGTFEVQQQSGRTIAGQMLESWIRESADELAETASRLRAVTVDDVVRVAAQTLQDSLRAEYVVRGRRS
jgi:zinc protease